MVVSIPQRDFGEFQLTDTRSPDSPAPPFQSLKGILVNFNWGKIKPSSGGSLVSIPQRDFGEFQRAGTDDGDGERRTVSIPQRDFGEFQQFFWQSSESRIKVSIPQRDFGEFQRKWSWKMPTLYLVSIPQRDFGEFQPELAAFLGLAKQPVSIPQRDFGEFQRGEIEAMEFINRFQSLKGILVNFNTKRI